MNIKSILVSMLALFALGGTSFADETYGPITIKTVKGKKVAYIDDDANVPLPEITGVTVDSVYFTRVLKKGGIYSTLMLPFEVEIWKINAGNNYKGNMELYEFVDITRGGCESQGNGVCPLQINVQEPSYNMLKANIPYIVRVYDFDRQIKFSSDGTTLNTTTNDRHRLGTNTDGYTWDIIGTYKKIQFTKSTVKGVYGFAGEEKDGTKIGTFKKGTCKDNECASVRAFRAYLKVEEAGKASQVRGLAKEGNEVASLEDLPSTIEVHLITGKDSTMYLGTMDTRTGEIVVEDRWFDMKGRRLMQKPTAKGTYYNNRKKVVIK